MSTSMGENPPRKNTPKNQTGTTAATGRTGQRSHDKGAQPKNTVVEPDRKTVQARQEEQFGGMKFGAAFFGWLTAVGTTVLLAALVTAAGSAVGFATDTSVDEVAADAGANADTVAIGGAIALLVVLFIAYFAGGYVAGRMARFNGAKQGVAVWIWAVLVALVVAVLGVVAGDRFDVLSQLDALPQIPVSTDDATTTGIIALIAVAAITLIGAILGGVTGMRYHRNVDKAGLADRA